MGTNTMLSVLFHFSDVSTVLWMDKNFLLEIYCYENWGTEKCENQMIMFWYFAFTFFQFTTKQS